VECK